MNPIRNRKTVKAWCDHSCGLPLEDEWLQFNTIKESSSAISTNGLTPKTTQNWRNLTDDRSNIFSYFQKSSWLKVWMDCWKEENLHENKKYIKGRATRKKRGLAQGWSLVEPHATDGQKMSGSYQVNFVVTCVKGSTEL